MGTSLNSLLNSPKFCTAKRSPTWGMTPMHGPRWAAAATAAGVAPASDFSGAGFFAAGLVGEDLLGEGLGAGVGAFWARAGCTIVSANNRATVRITTNSSSQPQRRVRP